MCLCMHRYEHIEHNTHTDRQTDKETARHTDKQTYKHTVIHIHTNTYKQTNNNYYITLRYMTQHDIT